MARNVMPPADELVLVAVTSGVAALVARNTGSDLWTFGVFALFVPVLFWLRRRRRRSGPRDDEGS